MNNELLLLSGKDIPFIEAQVNIHQPTISEISYINEENFFAGTQFLTLSKNKLNDEDKIGLENKSDFEIFMSIMCSKEKIKYKNSVLMVLALLFPDYQLKFTNKEILMVSEKGSTRINNTNYDTFKDILICMFELNELGAEVGDYNPIDKRATKIAEKLKKHKEKIAKQKSESQKIAVLSRYASILSIGLKMDINIFMNYTVFQLKDAIKRFNKKQEFDLYVKSRLAGAQDLDEVDNWMDDIHTSVI